MRRRWRRSPNALPRRPFVAIVSLASTLRAGFYGNGQLAFMGLVLMLVYLAWVEIAFLLFMLFFAAA